MSLPEDVIEEKEESREGLEGNVVEEGEGADPKAGKSDILLVSVLSEYASDERQFETVAKWETPKHPTFYQYTLFAANSTC